MLSSPGARFRQALAQEIPLQIIGTINAFCALLAERADFRAIYLSGAGVANASYGLPDLGITNLDNVLEDVRRITGVCSLPLLVDIDTGWGSAFNISHAISEMIKAGAAAVHMEDQVFAKRCGHRPGKQLVSTQEMCDRIKVAIAAKTDADFMVIARTDAAAVEGLPAAIDRSLAYIDAGAEAIFAEALISLDQYQQFCSVVKVPVLANITEFGKTPLYDIRELAKTGVKMVLYPLSAFRAMSFAAEQVYQTIREQGTQTSLLKQMQDRETLYEVLNYHEYEAKLDQWLANSLEKKNK